MIPAEQGRFSWWLTSLLVIMVAVVLITMGEPVISQSSDGNSTAVTMYCSAYGNIMEKYKYFFINLNTTFSSLRRQVSISKYATAHTLLNGVSVWGRAWCRGYLSIPDCLQCFDSAVAQLKTCVLSHGGHVIHSDCEVRYEDYNFYTEFNSFISVSSCSNITSTQPKEFRKETQKLLRDLQIAAPRSFNFYAVSSRQVAVGNSRVYAIAQCTLNISQSDCLECLKSRSRSLYNCLPSTSGQEIDNGCIMRYSRTPFFGQNQTTDIASLLLDGDSNMQSSTIGEIVGGVCFLLLILAFFLWRCRIKYRGSRSRKDEPDLKGIFNYNYKELELATNNFSPENSIGKGGFGEVFKAILDDQKVVAVKRLNFQHRRAKVEFENEALLVSNIYHRNLLRLLGWSGDSSNLLLVLEYMPNGSLDKFLWGAKRGTLNWKQRYDIIFGIARGLAHLHQEFHVKIIHRDIKSSNILLDNDLQPKIADFGLAKLLLEDQSQVITKFAGTLGYTAPEYALRGQLSEKVDTFSFGVVTLEIISGQRSTEMNFNSSSAEFLLEHAWKLYENKKHNELMDQTMDVNRYEEEQAAKIIEIALLCTQSPVSKRPTMSEVVLMLPNGLCLEKIQLTKPTFIDYNRRIRVVSSGNSIRIGNVSQNLKELEANEQLHSDKADCEADAMENWMNATKIK